jgi:mannosyltransferase OCH1-like enzyme
MSIPKILFQTWKSHTVIPDNFRYWSQTWKTHNPDYEYILWDDADNRAFIADKFPWFLPTFDGYKKNIQRADAVRYFFLYYYGGIYADMDFECLKPVDTLFTTNPAATVIMGRMAANNLGHVQPHTIPNAVMLSRPRDEFWVYVFQQLMLRKNIASVEESTGPCMLYAAIHDYNKKRKHHGIRRSILNIMRRNIPTQPTVSLYVSILEHLGSELAPEVNTNLLILDPSYLYPLSWATNNNDRVSALKNINYTNLTQTSKAKYTNAYAVTYWTHSW